MTSPETPRDPLQEARRALSALYLEVHESIARDVSVRVEAAFAFLASPAREPAPTEGFPTPEEAKAAHDRLRARVAKMTPDEKVALVGRLEKLGEEVDEADAMFEAGRREGVEEAAKEAERTIANCLALPGPTGDSCPRCQALRYAAKCIRELASSPKRGDAADGMVCTSCGQPAKGIGAALDPSHVCRPAPSSGSRDAPTGAERYLADRLRDPAFRAAYDDERRALADAGLRERVEAQRIWIHDASATLGRDLRLLREEGYNDKTLRTIENLLKRAEPLRRALASGGDHGSNDGRK